MSCNMMAQVQSDHYTDFWAPELQKAGYVAIYKKKTTEIFTDNKWVVAVPAMRVGSLVTVV